VVQPKCFFQKSTPKAASGLLSALPKNITDQFDENDKQKFKTTQENVNQLSEGLKDLSRQQSR
jgi:ABC-type Zn uptake system ZnuABC Zn-binding protein ZnuA